MDFTYFGGNDWGSDQILPSTQFNFDDNALFSDAKKIEKALSWPPKSRKFPMPRGDLANALPHKAQSRIEPFVDQGMPNLDTMVLILLIAIVIICVSMYRSIEKIRGELSVLVVMMAGIRTPAVTI